MYVEDNDLLDHISGLAPRTQPRLARVLALGLIVCIVILAASTDANASASPPPAGEQAVTDYSSRDHIPQCYQTGSYGIVNWSYGGILTRSYGQAIPPSGYLYSTPAGGYCSSLLCMGLSWVTGSPDRDWYGKEAFDESYSYWSEVWCG